MMKRSSILLTLVILLPLATAQAGVGNSPLASPSADYEISWWTVDGGGGAFSTGGDYELSGTVGQPDVGPALGSGQYRLVGGYWYGVGAEQEYALYLPSVLRNH